MKLLLERFEFTEKSTIGHLYKEVPQADGSIEYEWICYTLEDKCREEFGNPASFTKIYGETAIPYGTYEVVIDFSPKFNKNMPHLLNVPHYQGIRIHKGNDASSVQGCIALGMGKKEDWISDSTTAYDKVFFPFLVEVLKKEKVFIEITKAS